MKKKNHKKIIEGRDIEESERSPWRTLRAKKKKKPTTTKEEELKRGTGFKMGTDEGEERGPVCEVDTLP